MRRKKVEQEIKEKEAKFSSLKTGEDRKAVKKSIAKKKRQLQQEIKKES